MLNIEKSVKHYRTFNTNWNGTNPITRKQWIKNWSEMVFWSSYFDYQIVDVKEALTKYCIKNDLEYDIDGGWFHCVSNRKCYNDIMRICEILLNEELD